VVEGGRRRRARHVADPADHRRRGIGRQVVTRLLATVPGQHVALFTSEQPGFYTALGF